MKREHIEELICAADVYVRDAERELKDAVGDGNYGKYTAELVSKLEKELGKWTEIKSELKKMLMEQ